MEKIRPDTTKEYPANQYTPYLRVREFPSGSACLCSAASAITTQAMARIMTPHSTFNINSVELRLDNQNYRQNFANLKEYADDCAMSRHQDGMLE